MSRARSVSGSAELVCRPYPERADHQPEWPDRLANALFNAVRTTVNQRLGRGTVRLQQIVAQVEPHQRGLAALSDAALLERLQPLRASLRRSGYQIGLVGECFALLQEASRRVLGRRHFETQLMGGWALLQGRLVEMATGEGKTMTAVLAASTAALAGQAVHVITVNDYLARRDAEELGPLYRFLGLGVGTVVQGMEPPQRRQAYAQPVAYCTNKELAFDYLRDRVALGERQGGLHLALDRIRGDAPRERALVLRGLHFGIVDEADSVFIDEARTPLILSSSSPLSELGDDYQQALELAAGLAAHQDYLLEAGSSHLRLLPRGKQRIEQFAQDKTGLWTSRRAREELLEQALRALLLFRRDEHYVVSDGKVQIVDESTGRILPDRSWERGLHQMIEAKEGCGLTDERKTLARITYQRLFRRYLLLSGMTGTGREVAAEIQAVYGLDVSAIPLHRPSRRRLDPPRIFRTRAEKWEAVAQLVRRLSAQDGRPVLIGTRSVKASEEVSAVLQQHSIEHALLNAKQDQLEAEVIRLAGQAGRVTVATNMAGRGTDIILGQEIAARGGLHVILTEFHESSRIDRQLFGRCARQGDPGSCSVLVSLDDEIFVTHAAWVRRMAAAWLQGRPQLPPLAIEGMRKLAQWKAERRSASVRIQNFKHDRHLDQVLAFSGSQQ